MHNTLLAIDADVRLEPEIPLLSLARLVHLRIALPGLVLGRGGRMNNGRIDDRAGCDLNALCGQVMVDRVQNRAAQRVFSSKWQKWQMVVHPAPQRRRGLRPRSAAGTPSRTAPLPRPDRIS